MKNSIHKSIVALTIMAATLFICNPLFAGGGQYRGSINAITGDVSYWNKFGTSPQGSDEVTRIQTHLSYVENLLRQKDVSHLSPELQAARKQHLDNLHQYWTSGQFPSNYDYPGIRRPCFIDKKGTVCAVGYLVVQSGHQKEAEYIAQVANYDYLEDMKIPALDEWVASSGFTKEECAMIQPAYCTDASIDDNPQDNVFVDCQNLGRDRERACRKMNLRAGIFPPISGDYKTFAFTFIVDEKVVACVVSNDPNEVMVEVCLRGGESLKVIAEGSTHQIPPRTIILPPQSQNNNAGNYGCQLAQADSLGSEEATFSINPGQLPGIDPPIIIVPGKRSESESTLDNSPDRQGLYIYTNSPNTENILQFNLAESKKISLQLYDIMGRQVAILFNGMAEEAQTYTVKFNGGELESGIYMVLLISNQGEIIYQDKMLMAK